MKKVFLCAAILAAVSSPAFASSLQDQLSAVAEAEQQGKMKNKGSMTNGLRSATGKSSKRSNGAQTLRPQRIKERQQQQRIKKLARINGTPNSLRIKSAIKVMKMSYAT